MREVSIMFPVNILEEKGVNIMGTKKTMLVLACALVMVFAMSSCAFAGPGPQQGGDYYSSDFSSFTAIVGVECYDLDTTLNNNNNEGVILQGSNGNDFIAVDDVTLTLDLYLLYNGNTDSFNTTVTNADNVTLTDCYNTADFTFTSTNIVGSNNSYDIDVKDSFNYSESVSGSFSDESFDVFVGKSFNGADFINYNDADFVDYDDNDGLDLDAEIWALVN